MKPPARAAVRSGTRLAINLNACRQTCKSLDPQTVGSQAKGYPTCANEQGNTSKKVAEAAEARGASATRDPHAAIPEEPGAQRFSDPRWTWADIFHSTSLGVALVDVDGGRIELANPAFARMHGYPSNELLGRPIEDLVAPAARGDARRLLEQVQIEGQGLGEWIDLRKNGSSFPTYVEAVALRDSPTGHQYHILNVQDATDRKRAEETLRHDAALRAAILDASLDAIITIDHRGNIQEFNAAAQRMFGYDRAQVLGKSLAETIIPPSLRGRHMQGLAHYLATGEGPVLGKRIELPAMRADGSELPVELSILPIHLPGQPPAFTGFARDLSDRKRAEAELKRQRTLYETILRGQDELGQGVAIGDGATQRFLYANEAFCRIHGYTQEEILALPNGFALMAPEEVPLLRERLKKRMAGEPVAESYELTGLRKDGSRVPLEIAVKQVNGSNYVLSIVRDITDRKHAEEELHRLNEELEGLVQDRTRDLEVANEDLEAFNSTVAHDLRSPLRTLQAVGEELVTTYGNELQAPARGLVERVMGQGERMARLLDGLQLLSRVSRKELAAEPVDLSALARSIADDLQYQDPERRSHFQIADGVVVNGDPLLLRLLLENLLGNAWKFTHPRPEARIEFGFDSNGSDRSFFVRDNGVGFDMQYVHKLFEPFQRLHGSREFEGMGIGLATVRRVVKRHGGRVWAEAQEGQGATFHFTLGAEVAHERKNGPAG